jgi:hypothetical protein
LVTDVAAEATVGDVVNIAAQSLKVTIASLWDGDTELDSSAAFAGVFDAKKIYIALPRGMSRSDPDARLDGPEVAFVYIIAAAGLATAPGDKETLQHLSYVSTTCVTASACPLAKHLCRGDCGRRLWI